jgi:hypothetical protein
MKIGPLARSVDSFISVLVVLGTSRTVMSGVGIGKALNADITSMDMCRRNRTLPTAVIMRRTKASR